MSKEKAIVHINNVSKIIGSKRIKISEGMAIHIQNELVLALKELEDQNMKKRKISKWRIKRGVNFHDEMRKGKYGWNEAAHLGWF